MDRLDASFRRALPAEVFTELLEFRRPPAGERFRRLGIEAGTILLARICRVYCGNRPTLFITEYFTGQLMERLTRTPQRVAA